MSSDIGVKATGLGKRYDLYDGPMASLAGAVLSRPAPQSVWALRDVDLDLKRGDCLGIVGRNGAGKSTFLELLAETSQPSEGQLEITGKVAALLELGAGFNGDFTGVENVRLSAALYGLSRAEIDTRLPKIFDFAGVGDFADRPTREYSSGMFARLAFSVCAHVDADILIVDEILGVGDVAFQQASMRFLRDFTKNGIALYVSHNEAAVVSLCNQAMLLEGGTVAKTGRPKPVLHAYHKLISRSVSPAMGFHDSGTMTPLDQTAEPIELPSFETELSPLDQPYDFRAPDRATDKGAIKSCSLTYLDEPVSSLTGGESVVLTATYETTSKAPVFAFAIRDPLGEVVCYRDAKVEATTDESPTFKAIFRFVIPFLHSSSYVLDIAVFEHREDDILCIDRKDIAASFDMVTRHIGGGLANVRLASAVIEVLPDA